MQLAAPRRCTRCFVDVCEHGRPGETSILHDAFSSRIFGEPTLPRSVLAYAFPDESNGCNTQSIGSSTRDEPKRFPPDFVSIRNMPGRYAEFNPKQQKALNAAAPARRDAMAAGFRKQKSNTERTNPPRNRQRRRGAALQLSAPAQMAGRTGYRNKGRLDSFQAASNHLSVWNPLNETLIPTLLHDGDAHPVMGKCAIDFTLTAGGGLNGQRAMVLMSNTGDNALVGILYIWNGTTANETPTANPRITTFVIPQLSAGAAGGNGPTAGRAMKASLTVMNSSAHVHMGGSVKYLNATSRIVWPTAGTSSLNAYECSTVFNQIEEQAETQTINGTAFAEPKVMYCHPSNEIEYTAFRQFRGSTSLTDFNAFSTSPGPVLLAGSKDAHNFIRSISTFEPPTVSVANEGTSQGSSIDTKLRPMSTICVLFNTPSEDQSYTLTARSSYYTRWPMAHVLGQKHKPIPDASKQPGLLSAFRAAASAGKDMLHSATEVAQAAAPVIDAVRGVMAPEQRLARALIAG